MGVLSSLSLYCINAYAQADSTGVYNPVDTVVVDFSPVVTSPDLDITFVNDTVHPWNLEGDEIVTRCDGNSNNYSSWLTLSFTSDKRVELSFEWLRATNNSSHHKELVLFVDGVRNASTTSSSYALKRVILESGTHVIAFKDSIGNSTSTSNYSKIRNLQVNTLVVSDYSPIISYSDVEVTFGTDINWYCPWKMEDNVAIVRGTDDTRSCSSNLTMSFNTDKRVELSFDWASRNQGWHLFQLYIDGEYKSVTYSSSYDSKRFMVDAGEHVIVFKDSVGSNNSESCWCGVKNVRIKQIKSLEQVVLTDKSKPLKFTNESEWPWITEDGYIQNTNYYNANTVSRFSTTFSIDKLSKFSYKCRVGYYSGDNFYGSYANSQNDQILRFMINGVQYKWIRYGDYSVVSVALEPDTYTLEWTDSISSDHYMLVSQISDMELSDSWVDVDVPMAGTLGVESLYLVDVLDDIELLKVKGAINATDWATINQMNNLVALDLSEAVCSSVPDNAFDGLARLSNVKLPEGILSIGNYAFRGTQILNIDIPNSVKSIGDCAFYQTRVRSVNFGAESQLESIGFRAFYECTSLKEFIMPNSVNQLGYNTTDATYRYSYYDEDGKYHGYYDCQTFYGCSGLQKIHFSDALNSLCGEVCYNCTALSEVHLPEHLDLIGEYAFYNTGSLRKIEMPESLSDIHGCAFYQSGVDSVALPVKLSHIRSYAFNSCHNLKYIELPSFIEYYRDYFAYCESVQTIVVRSATPPAVSADPFSGGLDKSTVTLKVPSFAVVNYKLDSYWYQFGNIVAGDDIDYWKITGPLSLTNSRRMNGKPDIDLYSGGELLISGNAPMEIGQFTITQGQSNPGRLLNKCDAVTADSIWTELCVDANKWYFITPLHDVVISDIEVSNDALYVFRYYDGANRAANGIGNSWRNVEEPVLHAGQGYIFQCDKATTLRLPAQVECHVQVFNTKDVTMQLAEYASETSSNWSWNFVGNPYPCYYDVYYMDFTAPITVWTGSTYKAYSIVDDDYVLSPGQAFFVQRPDECDSIVFHKEGRQLNTEISRASYAGSRSAGRTSRHLFDIRLQYDDLYDETRVVINNTASTAYEIMRDASKFMSFESDVPQICTVDDENSYAINERPLGNGFVKLAYSTSVSGMMTISANRSDGTVILYDDLTKKSVNLTGQDYTFYTDATDGLNTSRFRLLFDLSIMTGVDNPAYNEGALVKVQDDGITVLAAEGSVIAVHSLDGKKIYEGVANGAQTFVALPAGRYLVKVNAETVRILVY